jgi:hypothetical protein
MDKEEFERIAPRDDAPGPPAPGVIPPTRVVHPTMARKGFRARRPPLGPVGRAAPVTTVTPSPIRPGSIISGWIRAVCIDGPS